MLEAYTSLQSYPTIHDSDKDDCSNETKNTSCGNAGSREAGRSESHAVLNQIFSIVIRSCRLLWFLILPFVVPLGAPRISNFESQVCSSCHSPLQKPRNPRGFISSISIPCHFAMNHWCFVCLRFRGSTITSVKRGCLEVL